MKTEIVPIEPGPTRRVPPVGRGTPSPDQSSSSSVFVGITPTPGQVDPWARDRGGWMGSSGRETSRLLQFYKFLQIYGNGVKVDRNVVIVGRVSVAEAAELLGVHPQRIHQRIQAGSLPATRIGSQWSIEEADLELVRHRKTAGRPLSSRSAWALVVVASGDEEMLARLSPSERSRARARLRTLMVLKSSDNLGQTSAVLAVALGNRARRALFVASVRDLPDLRDDERLRLSGVSLSGSNISAGELVEGYVRARHVDGLVGDYLLSPAERNRANVVLHAVDIDVEDAVLDGVAASLLIRAADLSEHVGIREKNEAARAIAELHARFGATELA